MILKPYGSALGAADDSGDDSGSDDSGSVWSGLTGVLNSGAATGLVSGIFSLFGGKSKTSSSASHTGATGSSSSMSPWVYVAGGGVALGALALILRKRR